MRDATFMGSKIYCTSYCNSGHRVRDGKPVGHECYVLPPAAIKAEMSGDYDAAIEILQKAKPLRSHRGLGVCCDP